MPTKSIVAGIRRRFTKDFIPQPLGAHHNDGLYGEHKDLIRKVIGKGVNQGNLSGFNVGALTQNVGPKQQHKIKSTAVKQPACPKNCQEADAPTFLFRSRKA